MEVGTVLEGTDDNGELFKVRVSEIKEGSVVLDFNHPLAGQTLFFDITVLKIQDYQHP